MSSVLPWPSSSNASDAADVFSTALLQLQNDDDDAAIALDAARCELWRAADRKLMTERRLARARFRLGALNG